MGKLHSPLEWGLALVIFGQQFILDRVRRLDALVAAPRRGPDQDGSRGDVPGWVLITLMSAILVAGLLAIAGPALAKLFNQAMEQVQPGG